MARRILLAAVLISVVFLRVGAQQSQIPQPTQGDVVLKAFHFRSGETMDVKMHYRAYGTLRKNAQGVATNAVIVMHGTGGSGSNFVGANFAGELFGPGQLLDVTKYYVVLSDDVGHGQSSKPSDGMHAKFPQYGYLDMVEAEHKLMEALGANHLRLVMGTSMGCMHSWLWAEEYPDAMDAVMPLACLPTQIAGRNRMWRRVVIDAIKNDPEWKGGEYTTQPQSLKTAAEMLFLVGDNPVRRQRASPTLERADQTLDANTASYIKANDANDVLYAISSSRDYDPGPKLEKIKAPLFAVNFADDLINPPELGILEKEITRVPKGKAVVVPFSERTVGHGTHTMAAVWKQYLEELLKSSEK